MNNFIERKNVTVRSAFLDRSYKETSVEKINEILYDCLLEYNFYRPRTFYRLKIIYPIMLIQIILLPW